MKLTFFIETIDTVINQNKRTTAVEKELLNQTLYFDVGQVQSYKYSVNYVGQIMVYLMK